MSLETAPEHIKLAVDLIELLECNNIDPAVAEKALRIALNDYQQKLSGQNECKEKGLD
ncbi:DUF2496 domain-containing protein [Oceanospirillum sediminis]|uniref:DUF2496 domain-containing protein n=1 Tax=Oceanospirillum sediminis TaxID=2760088 RepID=A0A839IWN0_9GAMM|nr:DUF2496 domain-containing protein [Oceanospirillum sediminis]MBB1488859.1 DUF2496 domain-containing protein [Oceanospirillum sediminis]